MALALPLGADVPVFIFGQSAFAEGVGEQLHALTLPEKAYLVAQPDASVPTADIFLDANLTRDSNVVKMADFLASQNFCFGKNDLEPVVYRKYPKVFKVFRWLAEHGISARMSGSGACLVAEYSKLSEAVLAEQKIVAIMHNANKNVSVLHPAFRLVRACPGLNEHPLRHWIAK
jgi:4-diphosphocytidyl-2-C-methyl-D-erythritol kinase